MPISEGRDLKVYSMGFKNLVQNPPATGKLHRNVIFASSEVSDEAMSGFDLPSARELWAWLVQSCSGDSDVITIPHNSNLVCAEHDPDAGPLQRLQIIKG